MRRELTMLAQVLKDQPIGGWLMSEKLDGQRALWLPWTRGLGVKEVPWANRERDKRDHTCTGLWSRLGKVIHAPAWWLEGFPDHPLDLELWMGRGRFQELRSIVGRLEPDIRWELVRGVVLDAPRKWQVLQPGVLKWGPIDGGVPDQAAWTPDVLGMLELGTPRLEHLAVEKLPQRDALGRVWEFTQEVVAQGGEGAVVRHPTKPWVPKRVNWVLKSKPVLDSSATVVGYTWGKGKYEGMLGALVVDWRGKRLELSGMADAERVLIGNGVPGTDAVGAACPAFPLGSTVDFAYRELSLDGIPKEARVLRRR